MTKNGKFLRKAPGPELLETIGKNKVASPNESLMPIVFKGNAGYVVIGPESHQVYCFSSHDPELMIDARDVEALLKTGLFRINL